MTYKIKLHSFSQRNFCAHFNLTANASANYLSLNITQLRFAHGAYSMPLIGSGTNENANGNGYECGTQNYPTLK